MGDVAYMDLVEFRRRYGERAEALLRERNEQVVEVNLPSGERLRIVVSEVLDVLAARQSGRRPEQRSVSPQDLDEDWVKRLNALKRPGALDHLPD